MGARWAHTWPARIALINAPARLPDAKPVAPIMAALAAALELKGPPAENIPGGLVGGQ